MQRIKKGDEVVVISGRDKGKRGTVLRRVDAEHVVVEGVNRVKKHQRPNPMKSQTGGIVDKDMPIHVSNVALFNPATQKADRIGFKVARATAARCACSSRTANRWTRKDRPWPRTKTKDAKTEAQAGGAAAAEGAEEGGAAQGRLRLRAAEGHRARSCRRRRRASRSSTATRSCPT